MNDQSNGQKLFLTRLRRHRITVLISRVLILTVFLFLWELCARFEIIDSFIFSSPSKITLCFLEMLKNRSLFLHIGITLYETFISFILVILLSILAAILLWYSKKLSEILEPYLVVLNSLPKSALAPLLIVWLGATSKTIIIAGMSVAIFGSILNLYTAFINVDQEKIKLIYTLHGNRRHALTKVVLPSLRDEDIRLFEVVLQEGEKFSNKTLREFLEQEGMTFAKVKDSRHAIVSSSKSKFDSLQQRVGAYRDGKRSNKKFQYIDDFQFPDGMGKQAPSIKELLEREATFPLDVEIMEDALGKEGPLI